MSGIYISSARVPAVEKVSEWLSFTPDTWVQTGMTARLPHSITRLDAPKLWAPATDKATGTTVLLAGRIALDEPAWARAQGLPYEGGLACRWILDTWHTHQSRFYEQLNGAFLVVVVEPLQHRLHVFTDRMGMYPMYYAPDHVLNLCSHTDVLADSLKEQGYPCDIDWTTVAECLSTCCAVQPHTYYQQIKQMEPASHYIWRLGEDVQFEGRRTCWEPACLRTKPAEDHRAIVEELVQAMNRAVRRRTLPRLGRAGVMLSGGADSRVALFGAYEPGELACYTFYDEPNSELATSVRMARLAGAHHTPLQRTPDYYGENADDIVRISGGMWCIADAHFQGYAARIRADGLGSLFTGCYADYMFKGIAFNLKHRTLFNRKLPLWDTTQFAYQWHHGHAALAPDWQTQVNGRMAEYYCEPFRRDYQGNLLQIEDLRLRPLSREPNAAGRTTLWRTLPWDNFFADTDILKVYERMSPAMKLNGIVFGQAVARLGNGKAGKVPNNNYYAPIDATETERAFWFIVASLKRKLRRLVRPATSDWKLATTGSWPNWSYYVANSPSLAQQWQSIGKPIRGQLSDIAGLDLWERSLEEWAKTDSMFFIRLLTVAKWLEGRY